MTQLRRASAQFSYDRNTLLRLLLWMILGSMVGAYAALRSVYHIREDAVFFSGQGFLFRTVPRVLIFPSFMAAAVLFHCRRLFCFLFFCKGFSVAFTLCVCAVSGAEVLLSYLPALFCETVLPLPAILTLGAIWYQDAPNKQAELWPVFPALLPASVGLLLERLIVQIFQ